MGRLGPGGLIGLKPALLVGEEGLELLGLEPPLEMVTVAGDTLGVADRLAEGDGRAERFPPDKEELGMLPGRTGRLVDILDSMPGERLLRIAGDKLLRTCRPGDILEICIPGEMLDRAGSPGEMLDRTGSPGEMFDRTGSPGERFDRAGGSPGDTVAATAEALSLAAVLPLVAARLLLLMPPPGGGPVS